jgi:hypothetical protein
MLSVHRWQIDQYAPNPLYPSTSLRTIAIHFRQIESLAVPNIASLAQSEIVVNNRLQNTQHLSVD